MASTVVLPQGTYPIGTRMLGPASIPQSVSAFKLALDGMAMTDPALRVRLDIDLSLDNGATWASAQPGPTFNPYPLFMTLSGGATNRAGQPLAEYFLSNDQIPSPASMARQVKATVTIAGAPLTTKGTLTLT
jgi:hypothetical protein